MAIECKSVEQLGWLALREQLWPECNRSEHFREMSELLSSPEKFVQFIEYDEFNHPIAFVEVSIRSDYVNGTDSSPVAYLDGIFVVVEARGRGVARKLVAIAEEWALRAGCIEFASDAPIDNEDSIAMHVSLGFQETERVVCFKKSLLGSNVSSQ